MSWLAQLITRRRRYDDLSASIREHIEERSQELMEEGMPAKEAEQAARREFGNVALIEQRGREAWQWASLECLWTDVRSSWRQLVRSPGISIITVLTLALGLGANTAVFTLTWNIVLKGLPVPNPGQLVEFEMRNGETMIGLSGPQFRLLRQRQQSCTDLLAWASDKLPVRMGTETTQAHVQMLTGNAFQVLELQPYLGRFFDEEQAANKPSNGIPAAISYSFWQSRFHGDRNVLGQSLRVDNHPVTIVGVMPRAFEGLTANFDPVLYVPFSFGNLEYGEDYSNHPGHFGHFVLGRLKPGRTLAGAQAELAAIAPTIRKDADPTGIYLNQFFKDFHLTTREGRSGVSWVKSVYERPLLVLELLVVFVLALCCVNTALVMMARVSGRRHEFAVRSALGAGRMRLIRQILVETTLLTIPGLIAGLFLGWFGAHVLVGMLGSRGTPSAMALEPNAIIVGVNLGAALLVAFGGGLWPAVRASRVPPGLDLKSQGRTVASSHLAGWATSLQVAVSLTLVSAALLLGGALSTLLTAHSGFNPQGAVVATVDLQSLKVERSKQLDLSRRLLDAVRAKPGITAAGYIDAAPLNGGFRASHMFSIDRGGQIHSNPSLYFIEATEGYFAAAGTRVLAGETTPGPIDGMPNCVLSGSMAQFFFPHQQALGELVYASTQSQPDGSSLDPKSACRVTAIVEDAKFISLHQPAPAMLYEIERLDAPTKYYEASGTMIVRGPSASLAAAAVEDAANAVLPQADLLRVQTFGDLVKQDLSRELMLVGLSASFALLALLLTVLGLYGLLMREVAMRTREIGIRVALGATRREILLAIGRGTFNEVAIGLAAGIFLTWFVDRAARQLLQLHSHPGVSGFFLSSATVLIMAAMAAVVPARRAARVDPVEALRAE